MDSSGNLKKTLCHFQLVAMLSIKMSSFGGGTCIVAGESVSDITSKSFRHVNLVIYDSSQLELVFSWIDETFFLSQLHKMVEFLAIMTFVTKC